MKRRIKKRGHAEVLILDGTLKIPCECAQVLPALRNYACLFILINAHEMKKESEKERERKSGRQASLSDGLSEDELKRVAGGG